MKPYYWESAHGNFGDDLNLWLWDYLLPGFREVHRDVLLVGVGTVLNRDLLAPGGRKLVVGSGFGYGAPPDISDAGAWDIRCVRGPLTAERIGIDRELGVIDPAVMVADMPEFQGLAKIHDAIFLPHWKSTVGGVWPAVCEAAGLTYVDPRGDAKAVIRAIAQSRLVVAESMHAAILADAFRVPWVAVSTSSEINSFKWNDWAATLGVTYRPRPVPVSSRAEAITKGARFWGVSYEGKSFAPRPAEARPDGDTTVLARTDEVGTGLRGMAKQLLAAPAVRALRQAREAEPQLSADAVLQARKTRLREILADIRQDYF
ncbi:polysaccharide pyruvyl transferase family protein [Mesorhizobium xinjiangense]|uniref:polysaccharide pyruvyl transferase family protein n=1 Tax=Mesorhizobium xinjiangense TaxID=2678685 RepID=UPI0012ED6D23|nr:polysaccharide pyruvyl transferase family protein [Mesorhizobium xinjiangense]